MNFSSLSTWCKLDLSFGIILIVLALIYYFFFYKSCSSSCRCNKKSKDNKPSHNLLTRRTF